MLHMFGSYNNLNFGTNVTLLKFSRLVKLPYGEVFYKFDTKFGQPKAMIKIHVIVPGTMENLENKICMRLLMDCLDKIGKKYTYQADLAKLYHRYYSSEKGFTIILDGFNDKLLVLLKKILENIASFEAIFDEETFQAMHDDLKRLAYNNFIAPRNLACDMEFKLKKNNDW